jgi:hypothetical protein
VSRLEFTLKSRRSQTKQSGGIVPEDVFDGVVIEAFGPAGPFD